MKRLAMARRNAGLNRLQRLNRLRKKAENCHSERRVCAKNPSWSFVFNREGFFASLRMTTKALFPQPVQPVRFCFLSRRDSTQAEACATEPRRIFGESFMDLS